MDYADYVKQAEAAARLVESGDYQRARELLEQLIEAELSDRDKAMMSLNLAVVADKAGEMAEALRWYDRGIAYERAHGQVFVAECKAAYLAQQGRLQESLALYESLLGRSGIDETTRERLRHNIELLKPA